MKSLFSATHLAAVLLFVKGVEGFGIHNLNNNNNNNNNHGKPSPQQAAAAAATTATTSTSSSTTQRYYKQNPQESNIIFGVNMDMGMDLTMNERKKLEKQQQRNHKKSAAAAEHPSLDVKSCWSKAGIGTCFVLEETQHKKFQVVFDMGCTPIFDQTMKASHVVLSHVHMDHFGALFGHARAHSMVCGGSTPTYYIPEELVPKIEQARELFSEIDAMCRDDPESQAQKREKGLLKMNIVTIKAGKEIELKQSKIHNGVRYYLRPFDVSHCGHPSLGYTVVSKTTKKKLKEEYQGMDGKELGKLARSGVAINATHIEERIQACYSGDTNLDGLIVNDDNSDLSLNTQYLKQGFTAPLIICELTYLQESERTLAHERGHLNLFDIQPILKSHDWKMIKNTEDGKEEKRKIVFYHLSSRARTAGNILRTMATDLPKEIVDISEVALASFPSKASSHLLKDNGCIAISDFMSSSD
mmetsp:Transcript_5795/g.8709  ORF Transcript_5795/g.8709 Transcript_5795/m.8709 type:complete len:471 (-) Transcript_5795:145-1557(-)|eukprot:CAMPEP_0203673582 /NCGR_PEP_ID=MMETSP0090-20130426/13086_1 /ASSEMBLY_ACC=CAM_ASM_001088 /TAXON_ID=426623 /ORGANISM="Chaetoceros affinis, Strain CCMP159" /LENGTH=470 /DNA_ID=CAMNT_0050539273 /DNA_START=40 /DNA_END=1452 /DNA_ORIENTATION=+